MSKISIPADETRICRRVIFHGRVQGVWFRASTETEALRVGVAGWVRNLRDGTVEALLEGTQEAVLALIRFCERGPGDAVVERVEQFEETPQGGSGFRTRYD